RQPQHAPGLYEDRRQPEARGIQALSEVPGRKEGHSDLDIRQRLLSGRGRAQTGQALAGSAGLGIAIDRKADEDRQAPGGPRDRAPGDGGVGFMIITDGTVSVATVQGKTRKLGPGDSFGEMALLDQEGRSATITADSDVTMATIPEWNFKPFLKEHPEVAYRLLQTLSRRVRQAEAD